jgi:hypothetical protein
MTTYKVYFRSDLQSGRHDFDAETPEQALALAQRFAEEQWDVLDLDYYEACDCPINEIEVCDAEYNLLAVWLDDDMRLRLAARDMLAALQVPNGGPKGCPPRKMARMKCRLRYSMPCASRSPRRREVRNERPSPQTLSHHRHRVAFARCVIERAGR